MDMDKELAQEKLLGITQKLKASAGRLVRPLSQVLELVAQQARYPEALAISHISVLYDTAPPDQIELVIKDGSYFRIAWVNTKFYIIWNGDEGKFPSREEIKELYQGFKASDIRYSLYDDQIIILEIDPEDGYATPVALVKAEISDIRPEPFDPPVQQMNAIIAAMSNIMFDVDIRIGNQLITRKKKEVHRY